MSHPANHLPAGIESFIILMLFVVGSAFFNWLKKQGQNAPDDNLKPMRRNRTLTPRGTVAAAPGEAPKRKMVDWEAELRRMLDIDEPAPPHPHPVAPTVHHVPAPAVAPALPRVVLPSKVWTPPAAAVPVVKEEEDVGLAVRSWGSSDNAYDEAQRLEEKVITHLREVTESPVGGTSVHVFKPRSAEIQSALAMFQQPIIARQVVIASIILGPPKALET